MVGVVMIVVVVVAVNEPFGRLKLKHMYITPSLYIFVFFDGFESRRELFTFRGIREQYRYDFMAVYSNRHKNLLDFSSDMV